MSIADAASRPAPTAPGTGRGYASPVHDAAYKLLFSHPEMVEDLLRGFAAGGWSDALDFSTLEKLPAEFVSEDLHRRQSDALWRVRLRDRWLYLLVLLEFQSTVERYMALRLLTYIGLLYQDLIRRGSLGPGGELPPVLPVVLYNGRPPWTAALELRQTMAPVGETLARYQPAQRYFLLDVGRWAEDDLPRRNLISALVRLERSRPNEDLAHAMDVLVERVRGNRELARAFAEWIGQVLVPRHSGAEGSPLGTNLEEIRTMLAERVQEWYAEAREKGLRAGLEEGREQGREEARAVQRALLGRQAARKFDAATAERLAARLTGIADLERLAEIGEGIVECEDGPALLARVERLCGASAPGDGSADGNAPSRG